MKTYKVNGDTKYWATSRSALRNAMKMNRENNWETFWVVSHEWDTVRNVVKGFYLEDLSS